MDDLLEAPGRGPQRRTRGSCWRPGPGPSYDSARVHYHWPSWIVGAWPGHMRRRPKYCGRGRRRRSSNCSSRLPNTRPSRGVFFLHRNTVHNGALSRYPPHSPCCYPMPPPIFCNTSNTGIRGKLAGVQRLETLIVETMIFPSDMCYMFYILS